MKMMYNTILDSNGYKPILNYPVKQNCLASLCGISWHNWLNVYQWGKNGKIYSTDEAIEECKKNN